MLAAILLASGIGIAIVRYLVEIKDVSDKAVELKASHEDRKVVAKRLEFRKKLVSTKFHHDKNRVLVDRYSNDYELSEIGGVPAPAVTIRAADDLNPAIFSERLQLQSDTVPE